MRFANPWYAAGLLLLLLAEAALLGWALPFFRKLNAQQNAARRLPTVDGLRGLLALSVFFLHALEWYLRARSGTLFPATPQFFAQLGILPVTMFFFITGFVFWTKLLRNPSIPFRPFLKERFSRLGAAYFFACAWMFLLVAVASSFQRRSSLSLLVGECFAWLSFLGSGHSINREPLSLIWLGQAWTLRIEWYFYLSVPFLAWFARTKLRLAGLVGGSAILAALLGLMHRSGAAGFLIELARGNFFFLATAFSAGMLVAAMPRPEPLQRIARHWTLTLLSFTLIAFTLFRLEPRYGVVESACLLVPFACIAMGNGWFGLLTSRPVLFLGRISYSFYLLHVLTLATAWMACARWTTTLLSNPVAYWTWAALAGAIAIVLSAISYRLFEHPFLAQPRLQAQPWRVEGPRDRHTARAA